MGFADCGMSSCLVTVLRIVCTGKRKKVGKSVRKDPGRARLGRLATAETNFTKSRTIHILFPVQGILSVSRNRCIHLILPRLLCDDDLLRTVGEVDREEVVFVERYLPPPTLPSTQDMPSPRDLWLWSPSPPSSFWSDLLLLRLHKCDLKGYRMCCFYLCIPRTTKFSWHQFSLTQIFKQL